jgi:hypothetical protein
MTIIISQGSTSTKKDIQEDKCIIRESKGITQNILGTPIAAKNASTLINPMESAVSVWYQEVKGE